MVGKIVKLFVWFIRIICFFLVMWVYIYEYLYFLVYNGGKIGEKVVGYWYNLR